jgi:hypothetical protein
VCCVYFDGCYIIGNYRDLCNGLSRELCIYKDDGSGGRFVVIAYGQGVDVFFFFL